MMDKPEHLPHQIALGEDSYLELERVALHGGLVTNPRVDSLADEIAAGQDARP